MAVSENGSDQQLEYGKDVHCRLPSSTFYSNGSCRCCGRTWERNITNQRFADGIHALAEEERKLKALVESLNLHKV